MFYIDSEYRCHVTNPDGDFRAIDKEIFAGKCETFTEGYRFVPSGESWTRSDGVVFHGEMIAPFKSYDELDAAQREYERQIVKDYNAILQELGVEV